MMKSQITLTVNGEKHALQVDTRRTLLDVLRNDLGLTGTHRGCDSGECGACTVHMDGIPVPSCMLLAADCSNAEILTIEGLPSEAELHPVQREMIEKGGVQCGFCTPGMVMSAVALINENPHPTEAEVREALAGNLCRCTGYAKIIEAIMSVTEDSI
ncbi:MAG: (2Fe-2S)-binding protein [Anaerolineales bacterium]|jgi:carbon-monoxide dehydrogenase small subunit